MLTEDNEIPIEALPVDAFKTHLRLGTGFASDSAQDVVLESFLRASIAAVEGRTGKALMTRDFTWEVKEWRGSGGQVLPVAPVSAINEVARVLADDTVEVLPAGQFRLSRDLHMPKLESAAAVLPTIPSGGLVRVKFTAGFDPQWDGVPADLRQAVMLLATHYYEFRGETGLGEGCMPFGVTALLQRYRVLRLGAAQ